MAEQYLGLRQLKDVNTRRALFVMWDVLMQEFVTGEETVDQTATVLAESHHLVTQLYQLEHKVNAGELSNPEMIRQDAKLKMKLLSPGQRYQLPLA